MKRSYEHCNDNYYNSHGNKQFKTELYVPIRNPSTQRKIVDYEHLIESSTGDFYSKHLIGDLDNRLRLLWLCDELLGEKYERYLHVPCCTELYDAVERACTGLAWTRFRSILNQGYFFAGREIADTNTLVVSARDRMLLHIQESSWPGYKLFVRIEQKNSCESMSRHFSFDAAGKIDHYRP